MARWSAWLLSFIYVIQHKPCSENVTADCLSHLPLPTSEPSLEDDVEVVALTSTLTAVTAEEFKTACISCPIQTKLCELLTKRGPKMSKGLDPDLFTDFRLQTELSLQEDYSPPSCPGGVAAAFHQISA